MADPGWVCVTGVITPPPPWNVDDVTRAMPKGGVLVNVQEWGCFSKNPVSAPGPPPPFKNPGSAPAMPYAGARERFFSCGGGGGGKSVDMPSDCQILGGAQAYPSQ